MLLLSDGDRAMLAGERGRAPQLAMSILVRMAEVYGAGELMDISQAHIDSTIYLGDATLEFAERLASLGAKVAVPTSLNVSGVDECGWKDWAVKAEWAAKAARQMLAYERMGAVPTWTCAPYQTHMRPVFGQQIAWGESNAISFANSVIGARTERYPDLLDICCAIAGRVPAIGLHLTEHRAGEMLLRLDHVPQALQQDDQFFAVLGHLVGARAGDRIPVIDGIVVQAVGRSTEGICRRCRVVWTRRTVSHGRHHAGSGRRWTRRSRAKRRPQPSPLPSAISAPPAAS